MDGDEVAGVLLGEMLPDRGWVNDLAVRRPWRGRGLGEALLRHAFGAFYRRGQRTVALGVDSQSLTGATRLYERVGMRVERQYDICEKVLQAGAG
jgi:mycothiol synthase